MSGSLPGHTTATTTTSTIYRHHTATTTRQHHHHHHHHPFTTHPYCSKVLEGSAAFGRLEELADRRANKSGNNERPPARQNENKRSALSSLPRRVFVPGEL